MIRPGVLPATRWRSNSFFDTLIYQQEAFERGPFLLSQRSANAFGFYQAFFIFGLWITVKGNARTYLIGQVMILLVVEETADNNIKVKITVGRHISYRP